MAGAMLALGLAACAPVMPPVIAPMITPGLALDSRDTAPDPVPGECWHHLRQPALYETVTKQVLATPEIRNPDGSIRQHATFRSDTHQRQIRPRQEIWFRIPCPEDGAGTAGFNASLQRALKARGLYGGAVNGEYDALTAAGVRHYQALNGLDTPVLSLAAAQALGLVSIR